MNEINLFLIQENIQKFINFDNSAFPSELVSIIREQKNKYLKNASDEIVSSFFSLLSICLNESGYILDDKFSKLYAATKKFAFLYILLQVLYLIDEPEWNTKLVEFYQKKDPNFRGKLIRLFFKNLLDNVEQYFYNSFQNEYYKDRKQKLSEDEIESETNLIKKNLNSKIAVKILKEYLGER